MTSDSIHAYTWDAFGNATTIDSNGMFYDALDRMVEQNRPGSNTEFIYAPTGFKMQIMNGQSATADFVPLPGRGLSGIPAERRPLSPPGLAGQLALRHDDFAHSSVRPRVRPLRRALRPNRHRPLLHRHELRHLRRPLRLPLPRIQHPRPLVLSGPRRPRRSVNQSNPQSWNRYSYVSNGPTEFIDPLGYCQTTKSGIKIGCTGIFMGDARAGPFGLDVFDLLDFAFAQTPDRFGGYDFPTYGNLGVLGLFG